MEQNPAELLEKLSYEEKRYFSAISSLTINSSVGEVVVKVKKIDSEEMEFEELTDKIIEGIQSYASQKKKLTDDYLLFLEKAIEDIKRMST